MDKKRIELFDTWAFLGSCRHISFLPLQTRSLLVLQDSPVTCPSLPVRSTIWIGKCSFRLVACLLLNVILKNISLILNMNILLGLVWGAYGNSAKRDLFRVITTGPQCQIKAQPIWLLLTSSKGYYIRILVKFPRELLL